MPVHTPAPATPAAPPTPRVINPDYHETMSMTQMYKQAHLAASVTSTPSAPAPPTPNHSMRSPMTPYQHQHYSAPGPLHRQNSSSGYNAQLSSHMQQQMLREQHKQYHPPAPPTTFTLPESVTHALDEETAGMFLRDREGKVLWFTVPPLDTRADGAAVGMGHSLRWMARRKEVEERKRKRGVEMGEEEISRDRERRKRAEGERKAAGEVLERVFTVWAAGGRGVEA